MARSKAVDPRSAQLLIRLTEGQMRVLEAVAHLEKITANAYAVQVLEEHLGILAAHPNVIADLANQDAYAEHKATTTSLTAASKRSRAKTPTSGSGNGEAQG